MMECGRSRWVVKRPRTRPRANGYCEALSRLGGLEIGAGRLHGSLGYEAEGIRRLPYARSCAVDPIPKRSRRWRNDIPALLTCHNMKQLLTGWIVKLRGSTCLLTSHLKAQSHYITPQIARITMEFLLETQEEVHGSSRSEQSPASRRLSIA